MSFFPLEFHSKAYLVGLLAALIPLIIHLSRSRRTKKIRFSTTRFFTDQFLRSYRMSRLRELLLLVCRMALFALFAMALAQPFWAPQDRPAGASAGGDRSRAVVFVIDNSASMGYRDNGQPLLDKAQNAARTVLDSLRAGDSAAVVLAARRPAEGTAELLVPQLTDQLGDVRQAISGVQVSSLGTNLTAAVARAEALAAGANADSREVWVFSDLQDTGWELTKPTAPSDPSRVAFVFVGVRPQRPSNRAVTAVQFAAARPMVGVPFSLRPLLNLAADDPETKVTLYVDNKAVSEKTLEKQPSGRWVAPRFHHTFDKPGWHSGWVEVEADNLEGDNRRYFAVEVLGGVKALAVNGAPSQVPHQDELFFLRLALTAAPEGQAAPVDVDAVGPADLAAAELGKYRLVILANVESLPAAAVEKLEDFVAGGGSLLCFLGDKVNPTFYNETFAGANRRFGGLLPGKLDKIEGNAANAREATFIGGADFRHPALAPFQEPRNGTLLGSAGVALKAFWRVKAPDESVLLTAADAEQSPLLCEKAFGKGRVMLFTSTCDRDWTNFPIRPVFLPWTHLLVAYLSQQGAQQSFHEAGALVRIASPFADPTTPVVVKKPDGAVATAERGTDEAPVFLFSDTARPGIYTVLGADPNSTASLFAVNPDGYESDLTYLDDVLGGDEMGQARTRTVEKEIRALLGRPRVTYIDDPSTVAAAATTAGQGRGLWDWFLMIVLAIGLVEPWLANRISLRLYGRPRAAPQVATPLPSLAAPQPAPQPSEAPVLEGKR